MKILLVHNFYQSTHVGGEDLVFDQEKKALIMVLGESNVFSYSVSNDKINRFKLLFSIFHNFYHANKIYKLIKEKNIDIMHVHNYFPLLTPSIFKAAKQAGAKVVYTLHNYREWCLSGLFYRKNKPDCTDCSQLKLPLPAIKNNCYRNSKIQTLLAGLASFFYKKNRHLNYVDTFFVLSETQKNILKKIQTPIFSKITIKPNFVHSIQSVNVNNLNVQNIRKNYLFVGRLEEIKGIELLLNCWKNLEADFVLEVIGSGPDQERLQKKYQKNNILFLGKLPREQVLEKMAQAKYVIHAGIVQETQGLTIVEALAQGTPVIGFAIGTRKEYIQSGYNGFLCEIDALEKIILKTERLFQNNFDAYQLLCQQAILSAQPYMPNQIIAKQLDLYHALCGEKSS